MKTNAEIQATFKQRQAAKGLVRLEIWVPAAKKKEIKDMIDKLKDGWLKETP